MSMETLELSQPRVDFEQVHNRCPYEELVSESLWQRMTSRLEEKEELDSIMAERIVNESLGFLKACAENPGVMLSPSEKVDMGWHNFILYTKDYAEFCEREAGYFIHHEPSDDPQSQVDLQPLTVGETFEFLSSRGYAVDEELWSRDSSMIEDQRCSSHCRNTCKHGS